MKLTNRFRPKTDASTLHQLNDRAWQAISDRLKAQFTAKIGELLATHLERLYPPADMEFLAQYGCAITRDAANIQVRLPDGDRWEHYVSIELPRAVKVASSYHGLFTGGPRFSRDTNRGVNAETRAEIEAGANDTFPSWEKFCADQDEKEARQVPESAEEFLYELVRQKQNYNRDYRRLSDWPKERKQQTGQYPTWDEIAAEFPVVGKEIKLAAFMYEAHSSNRAVDHLDNDPTNNDLANLRMVALEANQ